MISLERNNEISRVLKKQAPSTVLRWAHYNRSTNIKEMKLKSNYTFYDCIYISTRKFIKLQLKKR